MTLDLSIATQGYIEDCEVCCRPIEINYSVSEDAVSSFDARRGDD